MTGNRREQILRRYLLSDFSLNPFFESVSIAKIYDYSCLRPSFVVSKSCVVIVSVVTLSADSSKYNSTIFEDVFYPKVQSSMGSSRLFLTSMNNSHALEILYLGKGDVNLPPENVNQSQQSAILIGSIVGSVVVGLAFISLAAWIIYRRRKRVSTKESLDISDDFELVEDPDTPFMDSANQSKTSQIVLLNSTAEPGVTTDLFIGRSDEISVENDDRSTVSELIANPSTAESDLIVSKIIPPTIDDEINFNESDASTIDDEMVQELENLIRADDWEGITTEALDDSSVSATDDYPDSNFSKEELQEIVRYGEWEELSKSSMSLGGTDISSEIK